MSANQSILTLAAGKSTYWQMAINLARSFVWWHGKADMRFHIVTDLEDELPQDLSRIEVVRMKPGDLAKGFSAKLHLDELAQAQKSLFIDADCLIVGNLESVFDRFVGRPVSVVGGSIAEGEWFGDVAAVCSQFGLSSLPKFNGGMYYLEEGAASKEIYRKARELEQDYDKLGLRRLRGRPNDELLMAIAMALHGQKAVPDDGTIMSDPFACPGDLDVSILRGRARLVNPPAPDRRHQPWYPYQVVYPLVVHFLGDYTTSWKYRAEAIKLRLVLACGWPRMLTEIYVTLTFALSRRVIELAKNLLRPVFHATFGPRKIPTSPRI